jgi:hypothetical protein
LPPAYPFGEGRSGKLAQSERGVLGDVVVVSIISSSACADVRERSKVAVFGREITAASSAALFKARAAIRMSASSIMYCRSLITKINSNIRACATCRPNDGGAEEARFGRQLLMELKEILEGKMAKNSVEVGLGDRWITSPPLKDIPDQAVKDAIKGALNSVCSCRVWINTTRKPCDSAIALRGGAGGQSGSVALSAGAAGQAEAAGLVGNETANITAEGSRILTETANSRSVESPFPIKVLEGLPPGEVGYFFPTISSPSGRRCCKITGLFAAPVPVAGISTVVKIGALIPAIPAGATLTFTVDVAAEFVGLDRPNECDLDCEPDTVSGSVDMVINGSALATVGYGPFGGGIGFQIKDLRIKMGSFALKCGTDVALTT